MYCILSPKAIAPVLYHSVVFVAHVSSPFKETEGLRWAFVENVKRLLSYYQPAHTIFSTVSAAWDPFRVVYCPVRITTAGTFSSRSEGQHGNIDEGQEQLPERQNNGRFGEGWRFDCFL